MFSTDIISPQNIFILQLVEPLGMELMDIEGRMC
jgi:hypothetical protein